MTQLPDESLFGDYGEWPGRDVLDSGGERLGGVREIYLDRETGQPEWVLVDVDGGEARFVPLADAAVETSQIRVAHAATVIRDAPGIGAEPRIDQTEERRLYAHYGLGYSEDDSSSGLPTDDAGGRADRLGHPRAARGRPARDRLGHARAARRTTTRAHLVERCRAVRHPRRAAAGRAAVADRDRPGRHPGAAGDDRPRVRARAGRRYSTLGEPVSTDFDTHSPPDRSAYEPPTEPAGVRGDHAARDRGPGAADVVPPDARAGRSAAARARERGAALDLHATAAGPSRRPSGGPLAIIKSRPGGIAVGVVVAAVLLLIIRRLR